MEKLEVKIPCQRWYYMCQDYEARVERIGRGLITDCDGLDRSCFRFRAGELTICDSSPNPENDEDDEDRDDCEDCEDWENCAERETCDGICPF